MRTVRKCRWNGREVKLTEKRVLEIGSPPQVSLGSATQALLLFDFVFPMLSRLGISPPTSYIERDYCSRIQLV